MADAHIGFIGLGKMGYPMARRLVAAGFALAVRDANPVRVTAFLESNRGHAIELSEASGLGILITMLPDSDAVEDVLFRGGVLDSLSVGACIIDMSSSEPLRTRAAALQLAAVGFQFIDAPVSGGVQGAIAGTLSILVGGDSETVAKILPILEVLGRRMIHVGSVGAGHAAKALNNYVSAAGLTAVVEALLTGKRFGIEPAVLTDAFNASTARNNTTENKVKQYMLSETFDSGFALRLMAKDLRIAMDLSDQVGRHSQLGKTCLAIWEDASHQANLSTDHTALYKLLGNK